jgi:hypothetical protein
VNKFAGLKCSPYICIEFKNTIIMSNFKSVEEAKAYLTEQGYYTDNLWCVDDVQSRYECTEDEAQDVLDGALNNEATMEQIWYAINFHAENDGLKEKETLI